MKNYLLLLLALAAGASSYAQEKTQKLNLLGPVRPARETFADYRTYTVTAGLHPNIELSCKTQSAPYSPSQLIDGLGIDGLKKVEQGEFDIRYTITRFERVNEDFLDRKYEDSPVHYIGLESNLEIRDKVGRLIYRRYYPPKVLKYIIERGAAYDRLVMYIIHTNFRELVAEFSATFLYGPTFPKLTYAAVEKAKSSKSPFSDKEFNESTAVFRVIGDVGRSQWPALLGEAQTYWKGLLNFSDASDSYLQKRVRFASLYNLAASYLLLGQEAEAEKLLPAIKEVEPKSLIIRVYSPELEEMIAAIRDYRKSADKLVNTEAVAAPPALPAYKKAETAFRYAEFEGEVTDDDGKVTAGKVRILSDQPEMVDLRDRESTSAGTLNLDSVFKNASTETPTVLVFVPDKRRPVRFKIKNLNSVRDREGQSYFVAKIGRGASLIDLTGTSNTKRYSLLQEVSKAGSLTLYKEFFPQEDYVMKRETQENFYTPPAFVGRRKSLKTYFAGCTAVLQNIDKGVYDADNQASYLQLFEDYAKACKK